MGLQYISDRKGRKTAVILPIKEYRKMQEELDDLHCTVLYDRAVAQIETEGNDPLPLLQAIQEIEANRQKLDL